jgi:hypothetical protein
VFSTFKFMFSWEVYNLPFQIPWWPCCFILFDCIFCFSWEERFCGTMKFSQFLCTSTTNKTNLFASFWKFCVSFY